MQENKLREENILKVAEKLLSNEEGLGKNDIAAEFFFRFDTKIIHWVNRIRQSMRILLGKEGTSLLSLEDSIEVEFHLNQNAEVELGFSTEEGYFVYNYSPLNEDLRKMGDEYLYNSDENAVQRYKYGVWAEAKLVAGIISELNRLIGAYELVPKENESLSKLFSQNEKTFRYQRVLRWVMQGEIVPQFIWPEIVYLESQTDDRYRRIIHPFGLVGISPFPNREGGREFGSWQESNDGTKKWIQHMPPKGRPILADTRIKIWTVYYLTHRGGGRLTEEKALKKWNDTFENGTEVARSQITNFQSYRNRILRGE